MNIISIIIGALAGSALSFEFVDLAPCGQTCLLNMFNQATALGCPPYLNGRPNLDCLCLQNSFVNGISDCAWASCPFVQDAENTLGLAAVYCTDPRYRSPTCADLPTTGIYPDNNIVNNNNNNGFNVNAAPRIDVLTYVSNGATYIATVTVTPAANANVAASSNNNNNNGGNNNNNNNNNNNGGLQTATAFVAPTGIGNTGVGNGVNNNVAATGNRVDYGNATSTVANSGSGATADADNKKNDAEGKGSGGAKKAAAARRFDIMPLGLAERVVAVVLGVFMMGF
ncbi:hypothetical protein B0T20DRAFT_509493 [Sordaria brevicollis]|uniref:CFEM domain-containing protein n=1 Tax=Sordaria brevicollis TaxID=83679 RepID=A0AAE0P9E5_SORBR|nr:hypothetical protein B0T20DRAFT_509493 [Sordaria brevicollis]